jgi:hypothetical protein
MSDQVMYQPNQVVELPAAGPQYANDATAKNIPGMVIRYGGKLYRYVQFDDGAAVTAVAGGVVHWKTLTVGSGIFIVTSDVTYSTASVNGVAGILGCIVTDQYYTWIGVGGPHTCVVAASTVAGDRMVGSLTDLAFDRVAAGGSAPNNVFGIALDTRETTYGTATVLLQNLVW